MVNSQGFFTFTAVIIMVDIAQNIKVFLKDIPGNVILVAVSKRKPVSDIMKAYEAGHRIFGENRVQELVDKFPGLPEDIEWHMIGHLQSNKVKYIASFVRMIHAVDSLKLLKTINTEASKAGRVIDCLLQFHIASEESKFGFSLDEADELLRTKAIDDMNNVRVCGVMGMATFTNDMDKVRTEFKELKKYFSYLRKTYFENMDHFNNDHQQDRRRCDPR